MSSFTNHRSNIGKDLSQEGQKNQLTVALECTNSIDLVVFNEKYQDAEKVRKTCKETERGLKAWLCKCWYERLKKYYLIAEVFDGDKENEARVAPKFSNLATFQIL